MTHGIDERTRWLALIVLCLGPAQACIGIRHHPRQWLLDLVSNRGCDCVPGQQPRFALAASGEDGAQQLPVKRRDLVQ